MGVFQGVVSEVRLRNLKRSVPAVAVMAVVLTGCSSVPDAVNPAEWYKSTVDLFSGGDKSGDPEEEARRKREQQVAEAAGQEQTSGDLPQLSDVEKQRESRNLGLAADPDRPRYAPAITRQDQSAAADPVRPAAPPPPSPAATAPKEPMAQPAESKPAETMAQAPKLTAPKEPRDDAPAATVPGVPQFSIPTRAEQEAEFSGFQNRMQKRLAEILAAAGEEPKFVRPSGMPSGVGVGETMVISGDGVIEPSGSPLPTVMEGANVAGVAQSQPLPPGATRVATIVFPNGSSKLSTRDRQIISQVVALQKERGGTLHVVGHSSSRTRNLSAERHRLVNYKMSAQRAKTVASELIRRGANRRTVVTAALSDSQPLYAEIMPNGEAGNRRAEIFLTR